jgi:farnesyl diphosphate synthase
MEITQACSLVYDDMVDKGVMRRGRPCWHTLSDVGLVAVNDAHSLHLAVYRIFDGFFKDRKFYQKMVMILNERARILVLGQCMDILTQRKLPDGRINYKKYTLAQVRNIALHKTAYFLDLSFSIAYRIAGVDDEQALKDIEDITLDFGVFFQMRDDFIDVYCSTEEIGKKGLDIQEGKCSWTVAKALEMANENQKAIIYEFYGVKGEEAEKKIQAVFAEIGVEQEYLKEEVMFGLKMKNKISCFRQRYPEIPTDVMDEFLEILINRNQI